MQFSMRKDRGIKLVRNYLVPEPNYHTKNFFTQNLLAIKMKKRDTYEWSWLLKTINTRIK